MATITADVIQTSEIGATRRPGWMLIGSFLTFIAVVVFLMTLGGDADHEARDAADAEGSTLHTISPEAEARIAERHALFWAVSVPVTIVPFVVFAFALRLLRESIQTPGEAGLLSASWLAGLAALVLWTILSALILGLLAGPDDLPPLVRNLDELKVPMTTGTAVLGLLAVLCAGLAVRRVGIASRMSLAAIVVAGILITAAFATTIATSAEMAFAPIAPMLPALLLGIGLVRAAPR